LYLEGTTEYTTCDGLFTASSSAWPKTSVFEMAASGSSIHTLPCHEFGLSMITGVELNKIVAGKPGTTIDATNGYIDPATLAGCVASAKAKGWNGGVMTWQVSCLFPLFYPATSFNLRITQYPDATSAWIQTVRASSWAV
jgi:chitinase